MFLVVAVGGVVGVAAFGLALCCCILRLSREMMVRGILLLCAMSVTLRPRCIIIIFIYCNWVVIRWQWLFYM